MKKLSIISVTYNCAYSIRKTLESVSSQNSDLFEYIVIDGGSVDGTVGVINSYKDKLAYFISEPDSGIYDAMNKGIGVASGDWLLFLNAGDVFYDGFSLAHLKWDWPEGMEFVIFPYVIDGDLEPKRPDLNVRHGMPTSHQAMFVASAIAKQIKFNTKYKVAADYEFFIKRYMLNKKCVYVECDTLAKVLPDGYAKENYGVMKNEYRKIIFENFGLKASVVYYFLSRPLLVKLIKKILPAFFFNKLKLYA